MLGDTGSASPARKARLEPPAQEELDPREDEP